MSQWILYEIVNVYQRNPSLRRHLKPCLMIAMELEYQQFRVQSLKIFKWCKPFVTNLASLSDLQHGMQQAFPLQSLFGLSCTNHNVFRLPCCAPEAVTTDGAPLKLKYITKREIGSGCCYSSLSEETVPAGFASCLFRFLIFFL